MENFSHNMTYPNVRLHTLDDKLSSFPSQPKRDHFRLPPRTNAGTLDTLPVEVLEDVLSQLDLRTLMDFRRVNKRATDLIDFLTPYKAITTHASNAIRGAFRIGTAKWITCRTLYEKLCTRGCEQCGDYGGYLYLLTCKRVCFICLSEDKLYLPLQRRHASRRFGLDRQTIETLPRMIVTPGLTQRYAMTNAALPH